MTQLRGIIHYELLMSWRRRSLPMLILFFLSALVLIGLLIDQVSMSVDRSVISVQVQDGVTTITRRIENGSIIEEPLDAETASRLPPWMIGLDLNQAANTMRGINVLIPAVMVMVVGIMPLLSDVVALDRHYKVRELLDSTQLHRSIYLIGKVLGIWVGLLTGIALCFGVFQISLYLRYGAYDLLPLLLNWLLLVIPLTLLVSFSTLLLTSWAGTRRVGLLVGIGLIPVGVYLFFVSAMTLGRVGQVVNPIYGMGTMGASLNGINDQVVALEQVTGMLLVYALVLAAVWLFGWGVARWREAR
ncbi:MAG: hypothetical protein IPO91_22875 [Chloroflexi bacterium]|nr:hypothetical protein [Chloroflexota bacterium]